MGPVNWAAVLVAAVVASVLRGLAYRGATRASVAWAVTFAVMLLASTMIGHNFARVGAATLGAKPWLYFMMSGGLALAFVAPALFLSGARHGAPARDRLREGLSWIGVYLAMGAVFWMMAGLTSKM